MGKTVKIKLYPDGRVTAEAEGFKGGTCEEATAFLDSIFGTEKRDLKDEYFESEECLVESLPAGWCG